LDHSLSYLCDSHLYHALVRDHSGSTVGMGIVLKMAEVAPTLLQILPAA